MRIHSVEIRSVRQFAELKLDLSAPLTVIGGPNGVGKTTLQEAILAAMFTQPKAVRESFVSQFDPDTAPTVVLGLSHGNGEANVSLTRCLIDDRGEWREGATTLKKKKEALDKIQEVLPISAAAAATLLWGPQDGMSAVLEAFPSDGHSLLTAATVRGSGPDPKHIIKEVEKDLEDARKGERGGQIVGTLIQARNKLQTLESEQAKATAAEQELHNRRAQLDRAKRQRNEINQELQQLEQQLWRLDKLEKLLDPALKQMATCQQMVQEQVEWERLEEEIALARKDLAALKKEYDQYRIQHRVARDQELAVKIDELQKQIKRAQKLHAACSELETALKSKKRPTQTHAKAFQTLRERIKVANDKMEATGVRYELSAQAMARTVRIAEDGQAEKEITLAPGDVHRGIAGRVAVAGEGLCFTAAGKEDLSGFKNAIQKATQELSALFQQLDVDDEAGYLRLAEESDLLRQSLERKNDDLKVQRRGATVASLQADLDQLQAARADNQMTLADKEACAGMRLPPASEIDRWSSEKHGEIQKVKEALTAWEAKRPDEAVRHLHKKNLDALRAKARDAAAAFTDADSLHREPGKELLVEVRTELETKRREQRRLTEAFVSAERTVADLTGQFKQAQPHRPLAAIREDLDEAREAYDREQVLQQARALLKGRIEEQIQQLAAHVPLELGEKITRYLAQLTCGGVHQVALGQDLAVAHVAEGGTAPAWQPWQLSCGERHQAALAVKIAVARAVAESSGPVFIVLDDSLVNFDPARRAATEEFLLDLVADGRLQIVLLTCHTDWAADFKERWPERVNYIELVERAQYYRPPPAAARG
jgi:DNA repair exonuclease SbcCD ATPase subunit